jgi:hypothetical protein
MCTNSAKILKRLAETLEEHPMKEAIAKHLAAIKTPVDQLLNFRQVQDLLNGGPAYTRAVAAFLRSRGQEVAALTGSEIENVDFWLIKKHFDLIEILLLLHPSKTLEYVYPTRDR